MHRYLVGVLCLCVCSIVLAMFFGWSRDFLSVQSVEVRTALPVGSEALGFKTLQRDLQKRFRFFVGKFIWSLKDLEKVLNAEPHIKEYAILRKFPHKIVVQIKPHVPYLVIFNKHQEWWGVSEDARLLSRLEFSNLPNVPVARGDEFMEHRHLRAMALEFLGSLPARGVFFTAKHVSELAYSERYGLEVLVSPGYEKIYMGKRSFRQRSRRVDKVLAHLNTEGAYATRARFVDARFAKKVIVTKALGTLVLK